MHHVYIQEGFIHTNFSWMCKQMGLLPWQPKTYQIEYFAGKSSDFSNVLLYSAEINRLKSMLINANTYRQFNSDLQGGFHNYKIQ